MNLRRWKLKKERRRLLKESRWTRKRLRKAPDEKLLGLLDKAEERIRQAFSGRENGPIESALGKLRALLDNELKPYRKSKARETAESVFWALLAVFLLRTFVVQPFKIPTGSMEGTLLGVERTCPVCGQTYGYYEETCPRDKVKLKATRIGDRILVNKFIYGARTPDKIPFTGILLPYLQFPALREPRRGDIVVFHYPENLSQDYVKRLAGLPGDTIEIRDGALLIDGRRLDDPEFSAVRYENQGPLGGIGVKTVVPYAGFKLPLFSPLPEHLIRLIESEGHEVVERGGRVYLDGEAASEYETGMNYYFVLGDNSANSKDSRFWGFVPAKSLLGRVFMVYWPPKRIGFPR